MGAFSNIFLSLIHEIGFATQISTNSLIANCKKHSFISGTFIKFQAYNYQKNHSPQVQVPIAFVPMVSNRETLLNFLTIHYPRFLFVSTIRNKLSWVHHRMFARKNFREWQNTNYFAGLAFRYFERNLLHITELYKTFYC